MNHNTSKMFFIMTEWHQGHQATFQQRRKEPGRSPSIMSLTWLGRVQKHENHQAENMK